MKQREASDLAFALGEQLAFSLEARVGRTSEGEFVEFLPADPDVRRAFSIRVLLGWRSVVAEFVPGTYSLDLIKAMGNAPSDRKVTFARFAAESRQSGGTVRMVVNGNVVEPTKPENWPSSWEGFSLSVHRPGVVSEHTSSSDQENLLGFWAERLIAMLLCLSPVEDTVLPDETVGLPEGAKVRIEVNRYERQPLNRLACLEKWGRTCLLCGFDFGVNYGKAGAGFIHVHHKTPLSQLGDGYVVDPVKDLIPVCPNCHAMIHRKSPPYTPDEIADLLRSARSPAAD